MIKTSSQRILALCMVVSLVTSCGGTATGPARITNYEAPGNLESRRDIGCAGLGSIRNTYSPADLYRGIPKCVEQRDFEAGIFLFALAGIYGRYDSLRVADRTAHQAVTVLRMRYVDELPEAPKKALFERLRAIADNPERLSNLCARIREVGSPNYYPRYMVQHGMGAFLGNSTKDGLVPEFNSITAWEKALDSYLHCPTQAAR
jgi:hypothetical protein